MSKTESIKPSVASQESIQDESVRILHILNHPDTPKRIRESLINIICDAANEAHVGINHPQIFALALPIILSELDERYAVGLVHAIHSVVAQACPIEVYEETRKPLVEGQKGAER